MGRFLSKSDMAFMMAPARKVTKIEVGARKQGNGNFTGLCRKTFDDGKSLTWETCMNVKDRDEAIAYSQKYAANEAIGACA